MGLRSWCYVALVFICAGCERSITDEYQTVTEDESSLAPQAELATHAKVETSPKVTPPLPSNEPALDPRPANVSDNATLTADLSVDTSRPFAVPLPERFPAPQVAEPVATLSASEPALPIKLLIPEKLFATDPNHQALRVSYDDFDLLKVLNMDPVPLDATEHFPAWLNSLNGQRVVVRGWMFPPIRPEGISKFLMMRDSGLCCFGPRPRIYDKVAVYLRAGVTTKHIFGRPFDVTGTFVIEPVIEDDEFYLLYHIEDAILTE